MITCSSFKFSKDMIGYDLRRNESVSDDYHRRFAPNMYSKVNFSITTKKSVILLLSGSEEDHQRT